MMRRAHAIRPTPVRAGAWFSTGRRSITRHSLVGFVCAVAFGLAARTGAAHQGYPSVLQQTLMAPSTPPCSYCHQNPAGSGPLNSFGSLLVGTYNLSSSEVENDDSLRAALAALQAGPDARYAKDIRMGVDPNTDTGQTVVTTPDGAVVTVSVGPPPDPIPQYGCAVSAARPRDHEDIAPGLLVGALILMGRRRRGRPRP